MNFEFWLRVFIDCILFILIMMFLFWHYDRKAKLTPSQIFESKHTQVTELTPEHLARLGEILYSAAVEFQEGLLEYESGGFIVTSAPNRPDGLWLHGSLILRSAMNEPCETPFPAPEADALNVAPIIPIKLET